MREPPSTPVEAVTYNWPTGLTGTIGIKILDNQGGTTLPRTSTGCTEIDTGVYSFNIVTPPTAGQYTIVFDANGVRTVEELEVTYTAAAAVAPAAGAYASLTDVQARAGALAGAWTSTSRPSTGDINQFLSDVAAEINALLQARGLAPPAVGTPAALALRGMNAEGALAIALEATYPEGSGLASASKQIDDARAAYDAAVAELIKGGSLPALALLEAGNVAARASSFWENEPHYGIFPFDPRLDPLSPDANPNTAPTVARGQSL